MKLVITTFAATLVASTAFAGGYVDPVTAPEPVVAPVVTVEKGSDWTGGYVGLQVGKGKAAEELKSATDTNGMALMLQNEDDRIVDYDLSSAGIHGGYLHDFGKFVAGGELDFNKVELAEDVKDGDSVKTKGELIRLRGRVGYDLGRWLPYATLGVAKLSSDEAEISENGVTYGLGVDFKATDNFVIGVELTRQSVSYPYHSDTEKEEFDLDGDLIQIRAAYHF